MHILSCSVAPSFPFFLGWLFIKNGLPQKGFPRFSRVTEQLSIASAIILPRQEKEDLALRLTILLFDNLRTHFSRFCRVLAGKLTEAV